MYNRARKSTLTECCEFPSPPPPRPRSVDRVGFLSSSFGCSDLQQFTPLPPPWIHYYNNSSSYIVSLCWCVVLTSGCRFIRNSEKDAPLLFVDGAGSMRMNHTYHSPFCTYSFLWFPFFICISFSFGYKIQLWCWNNKHLEIKSRTFLLYFLPYFLRHHDKSAEALDH